MRDWWPYPVASPSPWSMTRSVAVAAVHAGHHDVPSPAAADRCPRGRDDVDAGVHPRPRRNRILRGAEAARRSGRSRARMNRPLPPPPLPAGVAAAAARRRCAALGRDLAWIASYCASNSAFRARMPSSSCCSCDSAAAACSRSPSASARSCADPARARPGRGLLGLLGLRLLLLEIVLGVVELVLADRPGAGAPARSRRVFSPTYLLPAMSSCAPPPVDSSVKLAAAVAAALVDRHRRRR